MNDDDEAYVTVAPAVAFQRFVVIVMRPSMDGYITTRTSAPLKRDAADALAVSWAAASRLSIR